jgi:hypothetical protein
MPEFVLTLVELAALAAFWAALWVTFGIALGVYAIPWLVDSWYELRNHWDAD